MNQLTKPRIKKLLLAVLLSLSCGLLAACTTAVGSDKVPHSVWQPLDNGKPQDLIVEFNNAANMRAALTALPPKEVEVLKNYDTLSLAYLRFHTSAALKAMLASPTVVKAYEDRQENMLPQLGVKP
jgi:hypothetical protein